MGKAMRPRAFAATCLLGACLAPPAAATDQPIDGLRLALKRGAGRERLAFVSRDPRLPFPPVGSADDPAGGTPGGALIELFSGSGENAALAVPPGEGRPGWTAGADRYVFSNRAAPGGPSPVAVVVLRRGTLLKVIAGASGLALAGAQGWVAIRISTGGLRTCALFDTAAVRRDEAGRFLARDALGEAIEDCADGTLGGLSCADAPFPLCDGTCPADAVCGPSIGLDGCRCVSAGEPCGDTAPVCNGGCPAGEECATFEGYPFPTCACLPAGSVPCGGAGGPTCAGMCPVSQVCRLVRFPGPAGGERCVCAEPGPCTTACGGADCAPGFFCAVIPQQGCACAPIPCDGGAPFPTCGGSCGGDLVCQAASLAPFDIGICVCADPALGCDASCAGVFCPAGEVCAIDASAGTCSCAPPS
jgi:hypothetical protein